MKYEPNMLIDRYVLDELMGSGGEAEVWRAHRQDSNFVVAVKLRPPVPVQDREELDRQQKRFKQENESWVEFSRKSQNIVTIYDLVVEVNEHDCVVLGIVMEFSYLGDVHGAIQTGKLYKLIQSEMHFINFLIKINGAVRAGRSVQKEHSDIKPRNIMLFDDNGAVIPKLADFGISRALWEPVKGFTPGYAAPELILGQTAPSPVSDVYSMGITFYEIFFAAAFGPRVKVDTAGTYNSGREYKNYIRNDIESRSSESRFDALPYLELISSMTEDNPDDRPTLEQIDEILNRVLQTVLLRGPQYHAKTAPNEYIWSPAAHKLLQEELVYILVRGGNPILEVKDIKYDLERAGAQGYSLRSVSGGWDYVGRVWTPASNIEALRASVERNGREAVALQVTDAPMYQSSARRMDGTTENQMLQQIEKTADGDAAKLLYAGGLIVGRINRLERQFRVTLLVSSDPAHRQMSRLIASVLKDEMSAEDNRIREISAYEVVDLRASTNVRVLMKFMHSDFVQCRKSLLRVFKRLSDLGNHFSFSTLFDLNAPDDVLSDDGSIIGRIPAAHVSYRK